MHEARRRLGCRYVVAWCYVTVRDTQGPAVSNAGSTVRYLLSVSALFFTLIAFLFTLSPLLYRPTVIVPFKGIIKDIIASPVPTSVFVFSPPPLPLSLTLPIKPFKM